MKLLYQLPTNSYIENGELIKLATNIVEVPPRKRDAFVKENPRAKRMIDVNNAARELVDHIVNKHGISSYNDFNCPHMRTLAKSINYFPFSDPITII